MDIVRKYGAHTVLDHASISVSAGQCMVLTGDNGSGKTTLLHVVVGLRRPDSGDVVWKGRALAGAPRSAWREVREAWGFMPQQVNLPPAATVSQLMHFHAQLRGRKLSHVEGWLERAGLSDARDRRVSELSGGMQQRLGIVLTLFFEPELIVMDEPASNLDPGWRGMLADWATEQTDRGAAMLVTSQLDEAWGPNTVRAHCVAGRVIDWPIEQPRDTRDAERPDEEAQG